MQFPDEDVLETAKKDDKVAEEFKQQLLKEKPPELPLQWDLALSTGSTLLNLACSGHADVGFLRGGFYTFVGDSGSGKSFFTLTSLAEAANNPKFENYQLVFDNAENGALMDFKRFFGEKMADRIQPPVGTWDAPKFSDTTESFYYNISKVLENGPAIYVLDSMDSLTTDVEAEKFEKDKKANEAGKDASGSFGTSKAKINSGHLRVVFNKIRDTGSIIIIICQSRDNIGFGSQFNPKTHGGGHAITFYSHLKIWTSVKGHIKKSYKGKDREQGVNVQLHIKKNRLTGRDRKIEVPIYHSFGIDDIGSLVDYLVDEERWKETKGKIDASVDFMPCGTREKVVAAIQTEGLEGKLRKIAQETWNEVEAAVEVKRAKRYA